MRTIALVILLAACAQAQTVRMATEQYAAYLATNAAAYAVAPVAVTASNALAQAGAALARPVGVSTSYVESVVSTIRVSRVDSADTSGAYNQFSGSAIYQTSISPELPEMGFTFSEDFSANGIPPPESLVLGYPSGGWSSGIRMFPEFPSGMFLEYGNCRWMRGGNDGTSFVFTSDGLHGETGTAICWPMGRAPQTNIVIYRLSEASAADLIAAHENEAYAHNGRITALENRPAGLTTNDVLPWVTLSDNYSTNGPLRVVVSNRIFSLWSLK